jgi:hypothetical protein
MRFATCHPDRKHLAKGLCARCYGAQPRLLQQSYAYAKTPKGKAVRARWSASPAGRLSAKRRRIFNQYGITLEQYEEMLAAQNGVCAICKLAPETGKRLAVDHCHDSGAVRGLLCIPCNLVLGNAKENREVLEEAIRYLHAYRQEK